MNQSIEQRLASRTISVGDPDQMFAHIFNAATNAMAFTEIGVGRIVDVNRAWCDRTGVRRDEAIGRTALELGLWPSAEVREACVQELGRNGRLHEFETTLVMREGPRVVLAYAGPVTLPKGGEYILWEFRDVTDQQRAERELRESQRRFRAIFDQSFQFIGLMSTEGVLLEANRSALKLAGVPEEDVVGKYFWDSPWWSHSNAERDRLKKAVTAAANGEFVRFETTHRDASGALRFVDFSLKPVLNELGDVTLLIPEGRDITELKEAEQEHRVLLDGMRQAQKLESLGLLAGGIAHDFNNLLTAIMGNTSLAVDELPPDSDIKPLLSETLKAARRAADLAQQMLAYAGRGTLSVATVRLDRVVHEMAVLLSSSITRKASMQLALDAATVNADATQLRQVVMNLITNASDALGGGDGTIAVRTGVRDFDAAALRSPLISDRPQPGRYAFVEVEDSGCGMSEATLARIFDPFFTTKFTGRGLGLSAVLGIVRGHHGTLQVTSEPGEGSLFRVLLPSSDVAGADHEEATARPDRTSGSGTLLVVDDERVVRDFIERSLRAAGFHVLVAGDGREALSVVGERGAHIDGVVLDLTMPNMDGAETLERLSTIAPALPVLLISGFTGTDVDVGAARGGAGFLQKPFTSDQLHQAVKAMLPSGRPA